MNMTDFSRFKLNALTPAIGAELLDCDLTKIDATLVEEVRAALLQHRVVFFRDQTLTREQHIEFAAQFGELEIHPATPADQPDPEVLRIAHGAKSRGSENMWHSDVTWREAPSLGSVLRAIELPKVGGDTLFTNMVMAYDRLSDEMKEKIEPLSASHDIARVFAKRLGKAPEDLHDKFPPMVHPVVRTHPETNERLIYVNGAFTDHIVDMAPEESRQLLDTLYKTAWNPELQCRFRWREGSMAFWDNRSCQHFAASDYFPDVRVMERVTITGDRPYFDAAA
ncbi:MAG: TauD/TfdA family dioxygenase [Alphaproteobacteria bacterium]|nr:TauD/TfdA family dioxygenase [Alphaproteobacteria bacterium]